MEDKGIEEVVRNKYKQLEKWNIKVRVQEQNEVKKIVRWLECNGLPAKAWTCDTWKNLATCWGEYIDCSNETKAMADLGKAQIIWSDVYKPIKIAIQLMLSDYRYPIQINEINSGEVLNFAEHRNWWYKNPHAIAEGASETVAREIQHGDSWQNSNLGDHFQRHPLQEDINYNHSQRQPLQEDINYKATNIQLHRQDEIYAKQRSPTPNIGK